MVFTSFDMYKKNQFFYNTHGNYKNINLLAKNKYKKSLLTYNKILSKKWLWSYASAYSGSFFWLCGLRNTFLITVISLWDQDQTRNKTCQQTFFRKRISMLTDLKVSSLLRKCVFCARSELTGKWDSMELKLSFWNSKLKYINR